MYIDLYLVIQSSYAHSIASWQSEFMINVKDDSIREHAVIHLEKAIDLCHMAAKTATKKEINSGWVCFFWRGMMIFLKIN